MGQQQLLLLVIGVIIVAFAVMAAFPVLERGFRQDEADGLLDRALAIANHAAGWKTKSEWYGGSGGSYEDLAANGLQTLALDSTNIRGHFAITGATANTLEVTGVSDRYDGIGVRVFVTGFEVDSSRVSFDGGLAIP
jgi:hypothetical protein